MKIAFVTFGCRLNRAESLDLESRYRAAGHEIIDLGAVPKTGGTSFCSSAIPDLILVRGCSVTAKAQRDCEKAIAHLRNRFPTADIQILGCLPNANPELTTYNSQLTTYNSQLTTHTPIIPTATSRAYLKIQDGCNGKCTFCIVPHFRGPSRSVPFDEITARMKSFLAAGYREIVLTGCNLALYRSNEYDLASLLSTLAKMRYNVRIRLSSLEPTRICGAIIESMAAHPNICRFIHLSLQSGSDRVLKLMKRPYNVEQVDRFCTAARELLGPDLALGADIITGFPGETDEDFAATREFLVRHAFSNFHVFPYSERPGTPAATMDGSLPRAVRLARAKELTALGRRQREAFSQTFLNREVEVCVERGGEHGWTDSYLPCKWKGPAERRSLVRKRIVAISGDQLLA